MGLHTQPQTRTARRWVQHLRDPLGRPQRCLAHPQQPTAPGTKAVTHEEGINSIFRNIFQKKESGFHFTACLPITLSTRGFAQGNNPLQHTQAGEDQSSRHRSRAPAAQKSAANGKCRERTQRLQGAAAEDFSSIPAAAGSASAPSPGRAAPAPAGGVPRLSSAGPWVPSPPLRPHAPDLTRLFLSPAALRCPHASRCRPQKRLPGCSGLYFMRATSPRLCPISTLQLPAGVGAPQPRLTLSLLGEVGGWGWNTASPHSPS